MGFVKGEKHDARKNSHINNKKTHIYIEDAFHKNETKKYLYAYI